MKVRNSKLLSIVVFLSIFLMAGIIAGPALSDDADSFIAGMSHRAVLYPIFLRFFSLIFGDIYLWPVVIFQSLLAGFSTWLLWKMLCSFTNDKKFDIAFGILMALTWIIPSVIHRLWIPTSIWAEGVTFSLYFCLVYFLFLYVREKSRKYLFISWLIILICVLNRKQMLILLVALFIIYIFVEKNDLKKYMIALASMLVFLVALKSGSLFYQYVFDNTLSITFYERAILTDIMYFSTDDDKSLLNDDEKVLFDLTNERCKELRYKYDIQREQYRGMAQELAKSELYDAPNMGGTYFDDFLAYLKDKYNYTDEQCIVECSAMMSKIERQVIVNHMSQVISFYLYRSGHALLNTIIFIPKTLKDNLALLYAVEFVMFLIYALYIALLVKNRDNLFLFVCSCILLLIIIGNAFGLSLLIFPVCRYFIYNFGLFYSFLLINVREYFLHKKDSQI